MLAGAACATREREVKLVAVAVDRHWDTDAKHLHAGIKSNLDCSFGYMLYDRERGKHLNFPKQYRKCTVSIEIR